MDAMNKIKILLLMIACLITGVTMAQQRRISGTVSDDFGGIMMANVTEVDANNRIVSATTTDMNGNFTMTIKNPKNKLKITYMGFQNHVEVIGNKSVFKVKMKDASRTLDNVTVTHKRKIISNGLSIPEREISVARQKFNMDEMQGLSFESVDEALQGKIAGLDIVANSGNLGAGTTMRLRGTTTFNGNPEPLIVVDGHIFELPDNAQNFDFENLDNEEQFSTLLQVNPEDIAEIEVLKDASATAIWGSKGANGVLSIKTRRGSRGKTRVNFSYRFSGNWQGQGMRMLDGDGYTMMLKEAYFNPNQDPNASNMLELDYLRDRNGYIYNNYSQNTDWIDAVTQFGQAHNYYVTLTGGGEKATFRIGVGYDKESGTIIKQNLDRFTTRLALDYFVSDRIKFSSNFSLSFTDNHKNYDDILARAYKAMPNMSIYEYNGDVDNPQLTGNFFNMLPLATASGHQPGYTSSSLSDMYANGNPVAVANLAWKREQSFNITPQFSVEYKFLGKEDDQTQLNYTGDVQMQIYNTSDNSYFPAALTNNKWYDGINSASNREYKSMQFTTRHDLAFYPKFNNEDHALSALFRFELTSGTSNDQSLSSRGIPSGLTDPTLDAYLTAASTSPGEWRSLSYTGSVHYSYKSKYSLTATLRTDGRTDFGAGKKFGTFPGVSARWNIIDENFMKPLKGWLSMLAFRPGWGIVGNVVGGGYNQYNRYADFGSYGGSHGAFRPENLRLASLQWEKTSSWNLGFDLGLWNDLITLALEVYDKKTTELALQNVAIPSHTGFSSLAWQNVGTMRNKGWELYVNTSRFARVGKFSMKLSANIAQNINQIEEMDASVLESLNKDFSAKNETYLERVQIGNALGSIYGFRFKGIYAYDYDHNGYTEQSQKTYASGEMDPNRPGYFKNGDKVPTAAAASLRGENATCPIVYDANGNMVTDAKGNPLQMYFNGSHAFEGGDAIYEDINHDGQINALDIVYLGNSNPKCNGGFGIDLYYGNWSLSASFNYRIGNQIINMARMQAEDMLNNNNQSAATKWRWRKNGDDTKIPRAMNSKAGTSYNALASDRYVENGDYLRFQYLRMGYSFDAKKIKKWGLSALSLSASANNLWVWSKYTGTDPDVSASNFGVATDNNKTPRSKSFTVSLNVGF
jgi:TonB-linked SusC/RagA family outer membrane protein